MKIIANPFILVLFLLNGNAIFSQTDPAVESEFAKKINLRTERIMNDERLQVGGLDPDSIPSLPVGIVKKIGQTVYCIAIDSAIFKNNEAHFSAYMALDFPGATRKLAFAAKDIQFSPKGVLASEGVRLQLVSDHLIHIGPKLDLFLKGDGSNYVVFDCNGYRKARLKGEFRFKGDLLEPTNGDSVVTATLDVEFEDIQNIFIDVSFSPFSIKGLDDYKFTVEHASVDMSDFRSPSATLPIAYQQQFPGQTDLWRGFYLSRLSVILPRKVSKEGENTSVSVQNLFIDNSGVTGILGAQNVFTTNEGDMSGWGFSIEQLSMTFQSNQLVAGSLAGQIALPVCDNNPIKYRATLSVVNQDMDYHFTVGFTDTAILQLPALSSELRLHPSSQLIITDNGAGDKFVASVNLNGAYSVVHNNAKIDRIRFENLLINTVSPYIHSAWFEIKQKQSDLAKFPVSINHFGFTSDAATHKLKVDVGLELNLADPGIDFTASAGLSVTALINAPGSGRLVQFDKFAISQIDIDAATSAFALNGTIIFKENDPVFGKLFYGELFFKVNNDKIMKDKIELRAGFGKKLKANNIDSYRYWFFDGQVPVNIKMGQITLTKFIGGASYRVIPNPAVQIPTLASIKQELNPDAEIPFIPSESVGLGFKAGVGLKHSADEKIVNGDVFFSILFNPSFGIMNVQLGGEAYMLVTIADRFDENVANRIHGTILLEYDVPDERFTLDLTADAKFAKAIFADNLHVQLYIDPHKWYFWFNTPQSRATVSVKRSNGDELFSASAYFMFGTELAPMAPLPDWALNISGANSARLFNTAQTSAGSGLAFGLGFSAGSSKSFFVGSGVVADYYIDLGWSVDAGFDLMIIAFPDHVRCPENNERFGMNQRYCSGTLYVKIYAYGGGRRVVRRNDNTQTVTAFELDIRALLQGQFPNPSHFSGNVHAQFKILDFINVTKDFDFEYGQSCSVF